MFEINQEIIDEMRQHCPKWEVCLTGDLQYCCQVTKYDCEHLIVEPTEESMVKDCPRFIDIDSKHVCFCPVRKEIYRKHNK